MSAQLLDGQALACLRDEGPLELQQNTGIQRVYRPRATRKGPVKTGLFSFVDRALDFDLERAAFAGRGHVGHPDFVASPAGAPSIPEARLDDLDLDREEDRVEWRRRLAELAAVRLSSARARFEGLGIVEADGKLVSSDVPPDMLPDSDTTLGTG